MTPSVDEEASPAYDLFRYHFNTLSDQSSTDLFLEEFPASTRGNQSHSLYLSWIQVLYKVDEIWVTLASVDSSHDEQEIHCLEFWIVLRIDCLDL